MNAHLMESRTNYGVQVVKVQRPVFLGLIWGGLAIAILCCSLRFLARIRAFKKLLVDDYFVLLALVFVLANAIIWQIYAGNMYYVVSVAAGLEIPGNDFAQLAESYFKCNAAVMILFYSALWSIKISFLLFFKRLGTNVRGQKRIWWPVLGITLATYFACIGTIQYRCEVRSFEYIAINCNSTAVKSFQKITLKLNCAWDVITDCLIMFIPFSMLKGVQMNWRRKAALSGIFSLVIITTVFAIVRTTLVDSTKSTQLDVAWLNMWSAIEASIAIIVSCLATFRNLFSRNSSDRQNVQTPAVPGSSNLFLRGSGKRKIVRDILDSLASTPDHAHSGYQQHAENASDAQSIIDRHNHGAHVLDEMPRAV